MSKFQVSKFKNIELNNSADFGTGPLCNISDWSFYGTNSQLVDCSGSCVASFTGNGKVSVFSSLQHHSNLLDIHCPSFCDLSFNPFHDDLLALTSQDSHVTIYRLPIQLTSDNEFVSTTNHAQEILRIQAQNSKLHSVRFHSLIPDILVQASENDLSFFKIDSSIQDSKKIFSNQYSESEKLLSFAFSETSLDYAVLKENSGISLYDIRTNSIAQECAFNTSKNCPWIGFLDNGGSRCLMSTSDNCVQIWDRRSISSPISTVSAQNDSKLMPLIDHDTGLIFFVSYNSGLVLVCEEKQLISGNGFNTAYSVYLQHKFRAVSLASKRILRYDVPEVDRLYGLTSSAVVPMQFIVPRKVPQNFFGEYYPPTKSPINQKSWSELTSNDNLFKVGKMNLHPHVYKFSDKFSLISKPDGVSETEKEESSSQNSKEENENDSELVTKDEVCAPQADRTDGNIYPKCKFLRGTVNVKEKFEFKDEVYDGLATMRLMKTGKNLAVMPLGRNACDTLGLVNLHNGQLQTFQTSSIITDFTVDPFLEECGHLIAVGTNTGDVYLIEANANEQQISVTSTLTPACHRGAIVKVTFHPLFSNTLITVGKEDNLVQIWSFGSERKLLNICSQSLVSGSDSINDICWSRFLDGGNRLAVLVKTKDNIEKIVIFEYCQRVFKFLHEIVLPKFCFMVSLDWIVRDEFILATGRHRGDMKLFVWDTRDNYRQVVDTIVDSNPYSLYSYLDEDTGTLLLIPKGDRQIYIFGLEFDETSRALQLHRYDPFQTSTRVLACSFGQKINCDVMKMEIANGHILSDGFLAPFSLVVPRKNMDYFDDSLFPTTIKYWQSHFNDLFEMNDPNVYNSLERYSLQPKGFVCSSSMANNSGDKKNNGATPARLNITINQAIDNPYLAMQVMDQIESSLSTMISNFTVDDDIDIGRGKQNFANDSDEETDWD